MKLVWSATHITSKMEVSVMVMMTVLDVGHDDDDDGDDVLLVALLLCVLRGL